MSRFISTPTRIRAIPTTVSNQPSIERAVEEQHADPAEQRQHRQAEAGARAAEEAPERRVHRDLVEHDVDADRRSSPGRSAPRRARPACPPDPRTSCAPRSSLRSPSCAPVYNMSPRRPGLRPTARRGYAGCVACHPRLLFFRIFAASSPLPLPLGRVPSRPSSSRQRPTRSIPTAMENRVQPRKAYPEGDACRLSVHASGSRQLGFP